MPETYLTVVAHMAPDKSKACGWAMEQQKKVCVYNYWNNTSVKTTSLLSYRGHVRSSNITPKSVVLEVSSGSSLYPKSNA
jgi:hypothetical protein